MRNLTQGSFAVFILSAIAAGAPAAPAVAEDATATATVMTVELSNFRYSPANPVFQHGRAYRLRLVNTTSGGHDFKAAAFFAASTIAPADAAKVVAGKVAVRGGTTVEIELVPLRPGRYPVKCTHFLHSGFGMKGTITVN